MYDQQQLIGMKTKEEHELSPNHYQSIQTSVQTGNSEIPRFDVFGGVEQSVLKLTIEIKPTTHQ